MHGVEVNTTDGDSLVGGYSILKREPRMYPFILRSIEPESPSGRRVSVVGHDSMSVRMSSDLWQIGSIDARERYGLSLFSPCPGIQVKGGR